MPQHNVDELKTLLAHDGDYVGFCKIAGELVRSDPQGLEQWLLPEARRLASLTAADHANADPLQKTAMALGFLSASKNDATSQEQTLSRTLMALLKDTDNDYVRGVIASELTYLDQYLQDSVRRSTYEVLRTMSLQMVTPSIRDYLMAWEQQSNLAGLLELVGPPASRDSLNVYLVCSAKGGVGKSITSLALLKMLTQKTKSKKKAAIIDLDTSAPTLPFTLDIPGVAKTHGLLPCETSSSTGSQWQYMTFFDTVWTAHGMNPAVSQDVTRLARMAKLSILPVKNLDGASAVLLPDSPTYAANAASYWDAEVYRKNNLRALAITLDQLADSNHSDVVLDCRPGLWGANGFMLHYVSKYFPTYLLVLSSPNAPDLGTTLYESLWIAAAGLCRWKHAPIFLANMWPSGDKLFQSMDRWTNTYISAANSASIHQDHKSVTSACQIYAARMWCYLYWKTLPAKAHLEIHPLREDAELRSILKPQDDPAQAFPWDTLLGSDWYGRDLQEALSAVQKTWA